MKIAFTGDLVLQEIHDDPSCIFGDFKKKLDFHDAELCVNLESPFIEENMKPIKDKITLYAYEDKVKYLKYLSPSLINLSNNHINDFGNLSSLLTVSILENAKLSFFGVGLENQEKNVIVDEKNRIIYLSYSTRSTDFTGSRLFAESNFIGPYLPNFFQIKKLKEKHIDFKLILNMHWGIEDIAYPEPNKRTLAYELIDAGADLIIGHHPHIIQPYEMYKDKYIFYSLGNFYFPDLYDRNGEIFKKALPHQKTGIVPIFIIKEKIFLKHIIQVKIDEKKNLLVSDASLKSLTYQKKLYKILHPIYLFILFNIRRFFRVIKNPRIILRKLKVS
ncbi:CapA family protein [uncultured Maribacter sp.]|uniref:CapA family protein n=1 Tax=uncultured Maribacter sp. TaxID=431308 RepID=UPI002638A29C|nr:CapA family protein [uncultured Maribacter sp.]